MHAVYLMQGEHGLDPPPQQQHQQQHQQQQQQPVSLATRTHHPTSRTGGESSGEAADWLSMMSL